ncbi:hypothetical protein [Ralstonia phage RP13]|nr:hypothetical protein [Ralstonia phage RP13]
MKLIHRPTGLPVQRGDKLTTTNGHHIEVLSIDVFLSEEMHDELDCLYVKFVNGADTVISARSCNCTWVGDNYAIGPVLTEYSASVWSPNLGDEDVDVVIPYKGYEIGIHIHLGQSYLIVLNSHKNDVTKMFFPAYGVIQSVLANAENLQVVFSVINTLTKNHAQIHS